MGVHRVGDQDDDAPDTTVSGSLNVFCNNRMV
jgi:hypothetical protein